jgi:aryl-alcohol dehydrogenase-like predicted oxidoreductase
MAETKGKMRYRTLGNSGVRVSEFCLGTMMFGDQTDEATARRIVDHALEHGVNFIDTADVYAGQRSEEIVGRAIKANRGKWVLATKVAQPIGANPLDRGLSRRHLMQGCDASLRRLGTDAIDLYYIHRTPIGVTWENVVLSFGELIRAGKIHEWGLSNVRAWHIAHVAHLCDQMSVPRPTALQPYYNLMNRQPEVEVLPAARHFGLGAVPYSPIARGVLSGKYQLNVTPDAASRAARKDKRMLQTEWRPESIELAMKLKAHAESRGASIVHWAVAWVLNNKAITATIAGPRTFEQWTGYFGALDYTWTKEDEVLANSLVGAGHPSTPGYTDPEYPIEGRYAAIGDEL